MLLTRATKVGQHREAVLDPILTPTPPLSDGIVVLRAFDEDDVDAVVAACQDAEIPRWTIVPTPYTAEDARGWFETHGALRATGIGCPYAIEDAETGAFVGSIGLHDIDGRSKSAEVGYWIAREMRRMGYAARALDLVTAWAFESLGLMRVTLLADVRNVASQRVAEKSGYLREGVMRSAREIKNERGDMVLYARLPSDPYPKQRSK